MCAAPYNNFEDSYSIINSTSINRHPNFGDENGQESISVHSIILDNGDKSCRDLRVHEWLHLIVSLLNNSGYLAFVAFLMFKYMSTSDHYVFSTLIIIKFVFASYFLFHGIYRGQPFQIAMQMLTVLDLWSLDLIYYLFDISHPPVNTDFDETQIGLELMLFYLRSGTCLLNLSTGCLVAWKYWSIEQVLFKTVGTDMQRVGIFRNLFFGFSLMIFDMETSLVTLMLFLRNGLSSMALHEILVLSIGSVFLLLWILLGYRAVRSESRILTWLFIAISCIQPGYLIVLFIRNLRWTGSSEAILTTSSHFMSVVTLTVHLTVVAAVIVTSHYYGRGYGDALVNGIHVSVKNSAEYEELRRILFHPINPNRGRYRDESDPSSSRTILLNAEVY